MIKQLGTQIVSQNLKKPAFNWQKPLSNWMTGAICAFALAGVMSVSILASMDHNEEASSKDPMAELTICTPDQDVKAVAEHQLGAMIWSVTCNMKLAATIDSAGCTETATLSFSRVDDGYVFTDTITGMLVHNNAWLRQLICWSIGGWTTHPCHATPGRSWIMVRTRALGPQEGWVLSKVYPYKNSRLKTHLSSLIPSIIVILLLINGTL